MSKIYDTQLETLAGQTTSLGAYQGKVLLIVNVASACGLTPQYKGLQALYDAYKDKGLVILGFPCNQFGAQEPGTAAQIQEFCSTRFAVSFPMFAKIDVNGPMTHPLYQALKAAKKGQEGKPDIEWNFAKFLLNRQGEIVERYHPRTEPEALRSDIEKLLG